VKWMRVRAKRTRMFAFFGGSVMDAVFAKRVSINLRERPGPVKKSS